MKDQLGNELPRPVRRYFEEVARMEPPDDLMHATMSEVESEPRVNRFSLPAFLAISTTIAAAAIAAVVIGMKLLGGDGFGIGPSTPTPQPTPVPSLAATSEQPWDLAEAPSDGDMPAGRYYVDKPRYPGRIEFQVPEGWWHYWPSGEAAGSDLDAILVNSEDSGAAGSGWGLAVTVIDEVRIDPCNPLAGTVDASVTESVDTLQTAFETWSDFSVKARSVTISGYSGKRFEFTPADGLTCDAELFFTPSRYTFGINAKPDDQIDDPEQYTFLDVEGSVLLIWTTDYPARNEFEINAGASPDPEAHVQDQVQLHQILESIVITPH